VSMHHYRKLFITVLFVLCGSLKVSYAAPATAIADPDPGTVPAVPSEVPRPPPLYERPSPQRSPRPGIVIDLRTPIRCKSPKTCVEGWAGECKKNCKRNWNTGLCVPKLGRTGTVVSSEQCKIEERACPNPAECKAPADKNGVKCRDIICPKGESACTIQPPRKYGTKTIFTGLCNVEAPFYGELEERCERKEIKCARSNQKKKVCCSWSPVRGSCDWDSPSTDMLCFKRPDAKIERFYATANNKAECQLYFRIEEEALGGRRCASHGSSCGHVSEAAVLNGKCPEKDGSAKKSSGKR
jgi:hypothetical protein